jgi:hypothetical protein
MSTADEMTAVAKRKFSEAREMHELPWGRITAFTSPRSRNGHIPPNDTFTGEANLSFLIVYTQKKTIESWRCALAIFTITLSDYSSVASRTQNGCFGLRR